MRRKVGFIGLGVMGKPMARNLLRAGFELTVHDVNASAAEELGKEGARVVGLPCEVSKASDVVMTMLPDVPDVEKVYLGEHGLLQGAHQGLVLIDSSTIDPDTSRKVALEAKKVGVQMLDAPVGGGVANAAAGELIMLVGGEVAVVESCRDILETVGKRMIHVGGNGFGVTLKLINNLMMGTFIFSLVEGIALARRAGLDIGKMTDLQKDNIPRVYEAHVRMLTNEDFRPGFRATLGHKDVRLAMKMAQSLGVPLPVGATVKELLQLAINNDLGNLDWSAALTLYRGTERA